MFYSFFCVFNVVHSWNSCENFYADTQTFHNFSTCIHLGSNFTLEMCAKSTQWLWQDHKGRMFKDRLTSNINYIIYNMNVTSTGYSLFPPATQLAPGVYVTWLGSVGVASPFVADSAFVLGGVHWICLSRSYICVQLLKARTGDHFNKFLNSFFFFIKGVYIAYIDDIFFPFCGNFFSFFFFLKGGG